MLESIGLGILTSATYEGLKFGKNQIKTGLWGFIVETKDEFSTNHSGTDEVLEKFFFDEKIATIVKNYRNKGTKIDFEELLKIFQEICQELNFKLEPRKTLREFFNYLEEKISSNKILQPKTRIHFFKRRVQLFLPFYLAHHPLCNDFKQEVFTLGTWRICHGCTFVYSSVLLTFLSILWINPFANLTIYESFWLVIAITAPTWLALFHKFKHRVLKDIARITLGIGWGIAGAEVVLRPILLEKLFFLLSIGLVYLVFRTLKHRQAHKYPDQVCINCQDST